MHLISVFFQIGQMQGGIMGTMQKALLKAQDHIFFERGEMKDRMLVVKRYLSFSNYYTWICVELWRTRAQINK